MPENTQRAVFLSYASQDGEAALVLCSALRAAGVEVWFDQNELAGGDAWDAKIRRQIKECALFIPLISANTEARLEGYFRIEWKLAAQRTHAMAEERAFLLPVVIDQTRDADARVPGEFRDVQWGDSVMRACLMLGARDLALPLLRQLAESENLRPQLHVALRIDPAMEPFRSDPEIAALLAGPAASGTVVR